MDSHCRLPALQKKRSKVKPGSLDWNKSCVSFFPGSSNVVLRDVCSVFFTQVRTDYLFYVCIHPLTHSFIHSFIQHGRERKESDGWINCLSAALMKTRPDSAGWTLANYAETSENVSVNAALNKINPLWTDSWVSNVTWPDDVIAGWLLSDPVAASCPDKSIRGQFVNDFITSRRRSVDDSRSICKSDAIIHLSPPTDDTSHKLFILR